MNICDFGGYQVESDKTATLDWYEKAGHWGCECGHCRNFLRGFWMNRRMVSSAAILR